MDEKSYWSCQVFVDSVKIMEIMLMRWSELAVAALFICSSAVASFALDEDALVGMWLFDDGSGGKAKDSSGNGLDGILINDPEWVDNGKFGGALQFVAGDAQNVRVPLPHNDTVTIAMWASYSNLASNNIGLIHVQQGDFENADPGSKTIGMWVENTGNLWGRIIPKGQGNINFPKNEHLDPETWYHIAMVVDADSGKATQYVDGVEVGQVGYPGGELTGYDFANIGRQGNETWDGLLDEVVIFSKALSVDELRQVMKGLADAFPVEPQGKLPVLWGEVKDKSLSEKS